LAKTRGELQNVRLISLQGLRGMFNLGSQKRSIALKDPKKQKRPAVQRGKGEMGVGRRAVILDQGEKNQNRWEGGSLGPEKKYGVRGGEGY